ncbi:MAG: hypothetical protein KJ047_03685 [Anaerolineae bacterium]|nr:hypothetical protein [Anaerolineae bacterium]
MPRLQGLRSSACAFEAAITWAGRDDPSRYQPADGNLSAARRADVLSAPARPDQRTARWWSFKERITQRASAGTVLALAGVAVLFLHP